MQLPSDLPQDEAQLKNYIQAQQSLSGALSRLLVVSEQYPQLRATEGFRDLQAQLEGTENRIQVARRDYIEAVQSYNTRLATFPGNVIAGMFGFQRLPQLEIAPEDRAVPKVDFGTQKKMSARAPFVLGLATLLFLSVPLRAAEPLAPSTAALVAVQGGQPSFEIPVNDGWVTDLAHLLTPAEERELEASLAPSNARRATTSRC
jgi:hypothetical protein